MTGVVPLLQADGLVRDFPVSSSVLRRRVGRVSACAGMSLEVRPGEAVAIVGESGSGKTTFVRMLVGLLEPTAGSVRFDGRPLPRRAGSREARRDLRRRVQVVFQDAAGALDPRRSVGDSIAEPLVVHGLLPRTADARAHRVAALLQLVGLAPELADRFPHELSGGQRQRVGIARALAVEPELLVLDEPVSALDVAVQVELIGLLADLRDRLGLAYVVVAHDLSVVRQLCDRVLVVHLGTVVEEGSTADVLGAPAHPYTRALLSAVPVPDPARERARRRVLLVGEPPSASAPPSGCRFRTRCWHRLELERAGVDVSACSDAVPELVAAAAGHPVACHFTAPVATG